MPNPIPKRLEPFAQMLYAAAATPHGVLVWASDVHKARQQMYLARAKLGDPDLSQLRILIWDEPGQLAIMHGAKGAEGSNLPSAKDLGL